MFDRCMRVVNIWIRDRPVCVAKMYRLSYPDDPGMHNDLSRRKKHPVNLTCCTFSQELKQNWIYLTIIFLIVFTNAGVIFWNERHAVYVHRSMHVGFHSAIKLQTIDVAFKENDHKLVYLYGQLSTDKELTADDYGISIWAVKLQRRVEMYQWFEEKSALDEDDIEDDHSGSYTGYSYYKTWFPEVIFSASFYHASEYVNPVKMPLENSHEVAKVVKVGCFTLSKGLIDKINKFLTFTGHIRPQNNDIKLHAGLYYHTKNVWNPQVGDFRVEFSHAGLAGQHAEMISIVAMQDGQTLVPYITETGDEILILHFGRRNLVDMFHHELSPSHFQTWGLRLTTLVVLFLVVNGAMNLLDSIAYTSLIVRDIMHLGTMFLNSVLTLSLFMIILTICWIRYWLILGLTFFLLSVFPVGFAAIRLYLMDCSESCYHRRL